MRIQPPPGHQALSFLPSPPNAESSNWLLQNRGSRARQRKLQELENRTRLKPGGEAYCLKPIHLSDTTIELPGFCGS